MNKTLKCLIALLLVLAMVPLAAACDDKTPGGSSEAQIGDSVADIGADSSDETELKKETPLEPYPVYTDTDSNGKATRDPNFIPRHYDIMKGMWLDQWSMADHYKTSSGQRSEELYRKNTDKICAALARDSFNTLIIQVRPDGDSFFPSELYTPSRFVVGDYGREFDYDPFKIFIEIAHSYGLAVHAWVNPMRLMADGNIQKVPTDYAVGEWYQDEALREKFLYHHDNNNYWYLIPGFDEVQELVISGVTELCENYNIDAAFIDDYFYPTMHERFDNDHFETVKDKYPDRQTYRLDVVNKLVAGMYEAVKKVDKNLWFGISPAGNISNNLNALFADVRTWCSTAGYCDYIVPQVYWGFEHPTNSLKFDINCKSWEDLCTLKDLRLIIGIPIYRYVDPRKDINEGKSDAEEFLKNTDMTKRQLEFIQTMDKNDGFVFYTYGSMYDNTGNYSGIIKERRNFMDTLLAFPSSR